MVWLHRECEAAWLERMTITPIPPHSPQSPIDDAV